MENQIILAPNLEDGKLYYSLWDKGNRIPGSFNPYRALERLDEGSYAEETFSENDYPILLEPLIKWSD